jgi:hypothetical protein
MKILVDINHPAHVHYFKNFIWGMQKKGHDVLITASEKDVAHALLDHYCFDYIPMGNYGNSLVEKLINIPIMDLRLFKKTRLFNPDIFIGFGSIRGAHTAKLMKKPCINLDDTEHSVQEHLLYIPFTDVVLTPNCFKRDLGKKQIRYNGYTELSYLHQNYFTPNSEVLDEIGLRKDDPFIILRLVAWTASHDVGQNGIKNKVELVRELERYGHVLITSEGKLEKDLEKYKARISPEKMHDLLYYASLYIGEGATMATEAALLGTPSIYISSLTGTMGNFNELEENYGLLYCYHDTKDALLKAIELIREPDIKVELQKKRKILLEEKIDVTAFMIWLVENYPESCKAIREDPSYQDKFK